MNSAAKFWSALVDELYSDYPECDEIVLDTLTDTILSRELLFPADSIRNDMDRRSSLADIRRALCEAIADFELMGPPDSVRAGLFSRGREIKACVLPCDTVDADVYPFLLAWLLEWSEIPECLWNSDCVEGGFSARDNDRNILYRINISLVNEHVSEGLFKRSLTMRYERRIAV